MAYYFYILTDKYVAPILSTTLFKSCSEDKLLLSSLPIYNGTGTFSGKYCFHVTLQDEEVTSFTSYG